MKLYLRITLIVMSGIVLAGFLAGCTIPTKEDVARSTTEFNLVAEKAGNEMLLLNIIRASKRRPMYFTSIDTLRRSMNFEYGTGGVSIPFGRIGGGLNGSYSISPSASYNNNPVLDVSVLDAKEFTNGIMTPVPMETIEYYWSQGWHPEMLLHLFIRRIKIIDQNDPNIILEKYVNYPGDPCDFNDFQKQIQNWEWDIEVIDRSVGKVDANDVSKLKDLMEAQKAGLKLKLKTNKDDKTKLQLSHVKYVFTREPNEPNEPANNAKENKTSNEKIVFDGVRGTIYRRSPEAILYYLGEILRDEIRRDPNGVKDPNEIAPMIYAGIGKKCKSVKNRLFYARKKRDEDKNPCVSVNYEGTTYVIPRFPDSNGCCQDRSMHVLSLVSLLIGQQKKSELVPTTGVVSVIGR